MDLPSTPTILLSLLTALVLYFTLWTLYTLTLHPLSRIPGPLFPSLSRTWLMYHFQHGDLEHAQRRLHTLYGPIVRIAPNEVSSIDPSHIPTIYPIQYPLEKTDFYSAWRPTGLGGRPDMFSCTCEREHAGYRRVVGGVYGMRSMRRNEPGIDGCGEVFVERLRGFAERGERCDFGLWLEM